MAPFLPDSPADANAVGCKVDRFAARKSRARERRDRSGSNGPCPAGPTTSAGAAICGVSSGVGATGSGRGRSSYADELAAQIEQKRALKMAERDENIRADRTDLDRVSREASELRTEVQTEIGRQRQREATVAAREDSLTRFLAENENGGRRSPSSRPPSPCNRLNACAAGARSQPQLPDRRSAPFSTNEDPTETQTRRDSSARSHSRGASAPFATNERAEIPRARSRGPSMQRKSSGRSPFATYHDDSPLNPPGRPTLPPRPPSLPAGDGGQPGVSANVFASGANQNCGNMITDRRTSRVLRPPGGGGSLQLGAW